MHPYLADFCLSLPFHARNRLRVRYTPARSRAPLESSCSVCNQLAFQRGPFSGWTNWLLRCIRSALPGLRSLGHRSRAVNCHTVQSACASGVMGRLCRNSSTSEIKGHRSAVIGHSPMQAGPLVRPERMPQLRVYEFQRIQQENGPDTATCR